MMTKPHTKPPLTELENLKESFETQGFCIVRGLFDGREVEMLNEHFQNLRDQGVPGKYEPVSLEEAGDDVLKAYPRMGQPHRWDATARQYLVDPRLLNVLTTLVDEEVYAAQSMFYFKPPGARGQSLHQDQFYLQVKPGTCLAAWTALDVCDRQNGAMMLVPGTHDHPIDCRNVGKPGSYNGGPGIPVPKGKDITVANMEPGDTLFFNGSVIHGSSRNASKDRWRRSFIGHYVSASTEKISKGYLPLVDKHGKDHFIAATDDGGECEGYVATSDASA